MVKFIQDFAVRGGQHMDLQHLIQGNGEVKPFFWIRNLDDDPQHWLDPRGFHHRVDLFI